MLGGLLTDLLDWRAVFWVNVPIGPFLLLAKGLPAGGHRRGSRVDIPGAIAAATATGLLVHGLTNTGEHGIAAPLSWAPLILAALTAAFLVWWLRRARDPLLPVTRATAGPNLTALALTATTTPAMYLGTLYVQDVMRLPPSRGALLFPVFNIAVVGGSLAGPALLRTVGARRTIPAGLTLVAAGAALCTTLPAGGLPIARLLAGFALLGAGLGAASVAATHTATEAVEPEHQGVAAGVLNSSAQLGTAVGLAVLTPLATTPDRYPVAFLGVGLLAVTAMCAVRLRGFRTPAGSGISRAGSRTPR